MILDIFITQQTEDWGIWPLNLNTKRLYSHQNSSRQCLHITEYNRGGLDYAKQMIYPLSFIQVTYLTMFIMWMSCLWYLK